MNQQSLIDGVAAPGRAAWARFNVAETHRYTLGRAIPGGSGVIVWCMLNPSTADAVVLDPTIRRCMGFSRGWGFGELVVVNLFALRSTDPRALVGHPDPIGRENDAEIVGEARRADCLIVAWGAHPMAQARGRDVLRLIDRPAYCLGITATGAPRHPLYVRADQPRLPYLVEAP